MSLFNKKKWRKKILFISSPITTKLEGTETLDYFAYIIAMLSQYINNESSLKKEYDLVIKVPKDTDDPLTSQRNIINDTIDILKKNKEEYSAVIISPYNKNELKNEIANLCKITKVLLIDQGYGDDDYDFFQTKDTLLPPYVQSDWIQAGNLAAHSMLKYFIENKIQNPNILIVRGHIGSDERIKGFKKVFQNAQINKTYIGTINGEYSRQKAIEVFENFLQTNSDVHIDAIYCTNDAMALGVKVVLSKYNFQNKNKTYPKIIGNDGIRDITILIDSNDKYLYDTVDVDIISQVRILVKKILIEYLNERHIQEANRYVSVRNKSYKYGNRT